MDKKKFEALFILLCQQTIAEIVVKDNLPEIEATTHFYESQLYSALEDEKTKLWHLSPQALYTLYNEEQLTGHINYPEEA